MMRFLSYVKIVKLLNVIVLLLFQLNILMISVESKLNLIKLLYAQTAGFFPIMKFWDWIRFVIVLIFTYL